MNYLRNTWYVAGWSSEVETGSALRRILLDTPVVLFRDHAGVIRALRDRCPHRFVPLSMGQVIGDSIQCPYHGLRFDGTGRCVHNPQGNGVIPKLARVDAYPVVERHGAIWIWTGDSSRADAGSIPDFGLFDDDENFVGRGYLHFEANYRFGTDNIMDLSHIAYVHRESLGSDEMQHSESSYEQRGNTIWSRRRNFAEKLPSAVLEHYGSDPETLWDRSFDVRWDPPASLLLLIRGAPSDKKLDDRRSLPFAHLFTPETASTTHYWFAASYPKSMGKKYEARALTTLDFLAGPFEREDLPMLRAQQLAVGNQDFWELGPVMLAGDAGAARARRLLDKLIREENRVPVDNQPLLPVD